MHVWINNTEVALHWSCGHRSEILEHKKPQRSEILKSVTG